MNVRVPCISHTIALVSIKRKILLAIHSIKLDLDFYLGPIKVFNIYHAGICLILNDQMFLEECVEISKTGKIITAAVP